MKTHQFSRRTFLRGVGVTMALPWMESMRVWGDEAKASAPGSQAPVRLAVVFSGNGFHSREWWAKGAGKQMELGQVLAELRTISGLDPVIQLIGECAFELAQDPEQVDATSGLGMISEETRQLVEECDVLGQDLTDIRPLHLHHDIASVGQRGGVYLPQAGGA